MNDCIEWEGPRHKDGYGLIGRKKELAHRVVYAKKHGPIPPGSVVRHRCDNPPCVNEAHLLLGTQGDNLRDAAERNRMPFGEQNHASTLTSQEVEDIREAYSLGMVRQYALADLYGVNQSTISRIVNGKRRMKEFIVRAA